jgi:hypothetical protein
MVQLVQLTIILAGNGFACRGHGLALGLPQFSSTGILQHVMLQYFGALAAPLLVVVAWEAAYRRSWLQARTKTPCPQKQKQNDVQQPVVWGHLGGFIRAVYGSHNGSAGSA